MKYVPIQNLNNHDWNEYRKFWKELILGTHIESKSSEIVNQWFDKKKVKFVRRKIKFCKNLLSTFRAKINLKEK